MMRPVLATVATLAVLLPASPSLAFGLKFDWGKIPMCNSGYPNTVPNPAFTLTDVPAGTKTLRFRMVDLDVPDYDHGGGKVAYAGSAAIAPGAFKYQSPCPPDGSHTYQWTVTALGDGNKTLGTARASKAYP